MKLISFAAFRCSGLFAGSITIMLACSPARAATLTWDADTLSSGAQDGVGTWSVGGPTFWDGAANVATANDLVTDIAQFGSGGTLPSPTSVTVNSQNIGGLVFAATTDNGYILANGSGSVLGLGAGGVVLNSGAQGTSLGSANLTLALGAAQAWTNNSTSLLTVPTNIDNGANLLTVAGAGNTTLAGVLGSGAIATGGLSKTGSGTLTLSGANLYTGTTTVTAGTLALTGTGTFGPATNTLAFNGASTVDLGASSQTLGNLGTLPLGTHTGTLTNGSLTLSGASNLVLAPAGTAAANFTLDASALTALTITKPANALTVAGNITGAATGAQSSTFRLSAASNAISVLALNIGSVGGAGAINNNGALSLGTLNTIETNTIQVGSTRSTGTLSFQSGLTDPSASFRAVGGGSNRVTSFTVGENGAGATAGVLGSANFSLGTIDGRFTTITISRGFSGSTLPAVSGSLTMGSGTIDATNILLSDNQSGGGNTTNTGTFNQNAGTVIVSTLTLGKRIGAATAPRLLPTYNLGTTSTSALLKAQSIVAGVGTVATTTARNLVWNNGTIQNYDSATDLAINGVSTAAEGRLNLQLAGTTPHVFMVETARTINVGANTLISGTGALTKDGTGTLILGSALNSYTGGTILTQGTLQMAAANALGGASGPLTIEAGLLDLNGFDLGVGNLTGGGGTIANNATGTAKAFTIGNGNGTGGNYAGVIADNTSGTGTIALAKVGTGTITLSGTNTYTGGTTISGGSLAIATVASLPGWNTPGAFTVANGGTLGVPNSVDDAGIATLLATNNFAAGSALGFDTTLGNRTLTTVLADSALGSLGLTKIGDNTLTLTAANTYTGITRINSGTLALSGGDNRLPSTGTVAFTGGSGSFATLDIGSNTQTLAAITMPVGILTAYTSIAISGAGGSLIVNGNSGLQFGPSSVSTASGELVIDMSGLSNFTYNSPLQSFRVGLQSAGSVAIATTNQIATVTLANGTNTITSNLFAISDQGSAGNPGNATLNLGSTNILNADTFNIGASGRSGATLQFAPNLVSPSVKLRGTDGVAPVTTMLIGQIGNNATTIWTDLVDFSTGNGTVDAAVTTMVIGAADSATTNRQGTVNATYQMGAGTTNVDTLTLGRITNTGAGTSTGTYNGNGILTIDHAAGTLNAGTINLAENTITVTTGTARTTSGTINLTAGTLRATTVQKGVQTGTATAATALMNWTTGTVGNLPGTDLTWTSVPISLLSSGPHIFDVTGANTMTVNGASVISGSDSGITKSGTGTLVLAAANSYTGDTTVSAGTLEIAAGGIMKFAPTTNGLNNKITGPGVLLLKGALTIDLTNAALVNGNSWTLVDVGTLAETFDPSFSVTGFTESSDVWTKTDGPNVWTFTESTGILSYSAVGGFSSWIAGYSVGGMNQPADDFDNDGLNNLLEYALNGDPSASNTSVLPQLAVTATDFEFTYSRLDLSLADTAQSFQYNSNLTGWTSVLIPTGPGVSTVGIATVTITNTGSTDSIKVSIPKSAAADDKLFGRLQVTK